MARTKTVESQKKTLLTDATTIARRLVVGLSVPQVEGHPAASNLFSWLQNHLEPRLEIHHAHYKAACDELTALQGKMDAEATLVEGIPDREGARETAEKAYKQKSRDQTGCLLKSAAYSVTFTLAAIPDVMLSTASFVPHIDQANPALGTISAWTIGTSAFLFALFCVETILGQEEE